MKYGTPRFKGSREVMTPHFIMRLTPSDVPWLTAGQKRYLTRVYRGDTRRSDEPIFIDCKAHLIEIGYEHRGRGK